MNSGYYIITSIINNMLTLIRKYRYNYDYQKIVFHKISKNSLSLITGMIIIFTSGFLGAYYYQHNLNWVNLFSKKNSLQAKKTNGNQITYQVKEGDDLWKIAEKFYGSGFNVEDIANKNNISDPNLIQEGQILVIPSVASKQTTEQGQISAISSGEVKFMGDKYIVKDGDFLWQIAQDCYGDGNNWVRIAKANNLSSADAIYTGLVLKIPR